MRKRIHCGRVTTLVLLSLLVLTAVHGQDMPAKNAEGGEVQALKQELAEQKNRLEELRLVVLDQKKQIDSVKQQQSASASAAPVPATTVAQSSTKRDWSARKRFTKGVARPSAKTVPTGASAGATGGCGRAAFATAD